MAQTATQTRPNGNTARPITSGLDEKALRRFRAGFDIRPVDECWLWKRAQTKGYGGFSLGGRKNRRAVYAHRVSWLAYNGPIDDGLFVLHSCDTPLCVNPFHLFLGTQADNMQDMARKGRVVNQNTGVTHCRRGHPLTGDNVRLEGGRFRRCKTCQRNRAAERRVS